MGMKALMLLILIITGAEIFFEVFTKLVKYIFSLFKKEIKIGEKFFGIIKLIVVAFFLVSVIYFLIEFVKVLADWFGIPINKSIFDFF
ncbi:hypothetical protein [Caldisalinibacter kiritimatiensis]|uniref:Uncharacterized protein n=1 Tax=Caldisalinibacter kiritimatiensis TaxID=1304284 RepID=R1CB52_9FIRM|nr:hypothetical protein [Caldisalinibacter kiritimatiensis]EOC99529.1 hypothetical protein L21TH_2441 [Caldisalinibacter kiritimatiensis]